MGERWGNMGFGGSVGAGPMLSSLLLVPGCHPLVLRAMALVLLVSETGLCRPLLLACSELLFCCFFNTHAFMLFRLFMPNSDCTIHMLNPDLSEQISLQSSLLLSQGVSTSDVTVLTFSHTPSTSNCSLLCIQRFSSVQQG